MGVFRCIVGELAVTVIGLDDEGLPRVLEDRKGIFKPNHIAPFFHDVLQMGDVTEGAIPFKRDGPYRASSCPGPDYILKCGIRDFRTYDRSFDASYIVAA